MSRSDRRYCLLAGGGTPSCIFGPGQKRFPPVIALSLPVALGLIVFGKPILATVFGPEYAAGALALAILCVGQLLNAGFGSVGNILNMTGHERDTVLGVAIGAISNVALNLLLIPPLGIDGAAIAIAMSLLIWNSWLAIVVYIGGLD